ncbi:MAG: c-type cytochrome [Planctomycetes bacterium]|nr:c-type cytochrome [Planctomycetota bacterium]
MLIAAAGAAILLATAAAPPPESPQAPMASGAKLTIERLGPADAKPQKHTQRARLLSLAVERGETATPFVQPGQFRATFEAMVVLPARDRCRFRLDGRGAIKFTVNGEPVLAEALRPGKPIETKDAIRLKKGENKLQIEFESTAMGDGQFRLYWSGGDFGFEPIPPERLQWAADDADVLRGEQLRQGHGLFAERRCARCHEFGERRVGESAYGELDQAGPDLRQAGARLQADWIAAWLHAPRSFRADATMPKPTTTPQENADIAAWLASLSPPAAALTFAPDAVEQGKARFRQLGCVACHVPAGELPGEGALATRIPLQHVPAKWHPQALVEYLQEPRRFHPHVRMPNLRLSLEEATHTAAFLLSSQKPELPATKGDPIAGKHTAQKHGCVVCHALDLPVPDRPYPRLANLDASKGCLAEQPEKAPDHGFTAEQRAALTAYLPFADSAPFHRSPLDYATRHLVADRCTACHALDGKPSTWAQWAAREGAGTPLPKEQDPVAQGLPALTWVGSKLQPSWIERFVLGQEKSPRPWLTARMPSFPHDGTPIAHGLVREHGYGQADEPVAPPNAQLGLHGERLLGQGTGFACTNCHALGDKPAAQVFEREGIELITARGRLRHEYYTRWLRDPVRLDPDSRMPNFAPGGKSAFTDVLGGDGAQQFEAIWQYLGGQRAARR